MNSIFNTEPIFTIGSVYYCCRGPRPFPALTPARSRNLIPSPETTPRRANAVHKTASVNTTSPL